MENHKRTILSLGQTSGIGPSNALGRHGERTGGIAEFSRARKNVSEGMAGGFDGGRFSLSRRDRHVQIDWVGGNSIDGAGLAPEGSADDANVGAVVIGDLRDVASFHFLITGRRHL